jgi:hypothetical protein
MWMNRSIFCRPKGKHAFASIGYPPLPSRWPSRLKARLPPISQLMVQCNQLIDKWHVRRFEFAQRVRDFYRPHVFPTVGLFVHDQNARVVPADPQGEFMQGFKVVAFRIRSGSCWEAA